jgi:hypothetical protein
MGEQLHTFVCHQYSGPEEGPPGERLPYARVVVLVAAASTLLTERSDANAKGCRLPTTCVALPEPARSPRAQAPARLTPPTYAARQQGGFSEIPAGIHTYVTRPDWRKWKGG